MLLSKRYYRIYNKYLMFQKYIIKIRVKNYIHIFILSEARKSVFFLFLYPLTYLNVYYCDLIKKDAKILQITS